jgi:hypothetical protein
MRHAHAVIRKRREEIMEFDTKAMADLAELLQGNGIDYTVVGGENVITYRRFIEQYISIETTQFFSNTNCAMTDRNKQWRVNPFAKGDLGNIDISVSDQYNIRISALLPEESISSKDASMHAKRQIEALIPQCETAIYRQAECRIGLGALHDAPYIIAAYEISEPTAMTPARVFNYIQLFALEVHRIFGSIVASGDAPKTQKSDVAYTPDATDANGGYFVYELGGFPWWIVDRDFKFQSIVGEGTWKEQKDSEANGNTLMAADYDKLFRYENGMVYRSDYHYDESGTLCCGNGELCGRYYAERHYVPEQQDKAFELLKGNYLQQAEGFGMLCDMYRLFPEKPHLYGVIEEGCEHVERSTSNLNAHTLKQAELEGKHILELANACPSDEKIRKLADRFEKAIEELKKEEAKHAQGEAWAEQGLCRYCGGQIGFFKKCKKCGMKN